MTNCRRKQDWYHGGLRLASLSLSIFISLFLSHSLQCSSILPSFSLFPPFLLFFHLREASRSLLILFFYSSTPREYFDTYFYSSLTLSLYLSPSLDFSSLLYPTPERKRAFPSTSSSSILRYSCICTLWCDGNNKQNNWRHRSCWDEW